MKKLYSFALAVVISQTAFSQNDYNRVNFYPPSVASMMKYIDYPVSPRTGIPDIGIPLFTIRSGKLELPLTLSFHIDDYAKVNQLPGAAGAGWTLSSDIQISRSINGLDDLAPSGYLSTGFYYPDYKGIAPAKSQTDLYLMHIKQKDEEPDKFYYRLLGKGGSFYFMRQQNGSSIPKQVPLNGVQVSYSSGRFEAVDTDGTTYYFSSSAKDQCSPNAGTTLDMSWKCDRIVSASGADIISFDYVSYKKSLVKMCNGKEEVYDRIRITNRAASNAVRNMVRGPKHLIYGGELTSRMELVQVEEDGGYAYFWESVGPVDDLRNYQNLVIHNLSGIRFKNGRVEFVYDDNEVLTQIKLFSEGQAEPVRVVALAQEGSGYARTLRTLTVGRDTYSFAYGTKHEGECFPDFWGYKSMGTFLNGCAGVPLHFITVEPGPDGRLINDRNFFNTDFGLPVGLQSVAAYSTTATKGSPFLTIKYPTGGLTQFSCERNNYLCNDGNYFGYIIDAGGLRVNEINYFDTDTTLVKQKIYKYGENENGYGIIRREPTFDEEYGTCHTCQEVRYYTPYLGSYSLDATARLRSYLPNTIYQMNYSDGSRINYSEVAEYNKDRGIETGKTVYKYNLEDPYGMMGQYADPEAPYPIGDDAWWIGVPDSTIYYRYDNGKYEWVKKTGYRYECHMEPERIFQGRVWQSVIAVLVDGYLSSSFVKDYNVFSYRTSAIQIGCMQLAQEDEYVRNDDGRVQTTQTRYYYDNPGHYLPGRKVTTYPTGDIVTEHTLFPEDYVRDSYVQSLRTRNQVALPMERVVRRNGRVVSGESYRYDFYGRIVSAYMLETDNLSESLFRLSNKSAANDFGPSGTSAYTPDSGYVQRAAILYDEDDNIRQIVSPGKSPVCYLWGYNGQYLIAEIRNATYEQVQQKLGSTLLSRVRKAAVPAVADLEQIDNLRTDKKLQVTTATYRPLYGMASQTDPDGRTRSYVYNTETGRLLRVEDGDGNIETQYSYSQDL